MSRWVDGAGGRGQGARVLLGVLAGFGLSVSTAPASAFEGIGRTATEAEIRAWDIDVRPDFLGLPPGSGSVADGEMLWIEKCSSCHGDFGDANHVFPPLIGNTTAEDIKTGRVAALREVAHAHHDHEGVDRVDAVGFHQPGDALGQAEVTEAR